MSLGLAMQKVAEYSSAVTRLTAEISPLEAKLMAAATGKDDKGFAETQLQLTKLKTLLGLVQEFLNFWKDVIKGMMQLIKSVNELAFPGR